MHVDFVFFAERAEVRADGAMDVFGLGVPTFGFATLPTTIPRLTFFVVMMFAETDRGSSYPLQATVIAPNGKPITSQEVRIKRDDTSPVKVQTVEFTRITAAHEGIYRVRFEAGGQRREWSFHVEVARSAASSQSSPSPPTPAGEQR